MDIDMVLAFIFVIILVSIVMRTLGDMVKRRMQYKERELELRSAPAQPQSTLSAARAEQLEERVRVLERIVTDGNSDLARQIEALRLADNSVVSSEELEKETAR